MLEEKIIIANRFKQVLGGIISDTQKGFYERQIHG
jgi:hypothetical protein